MPLLVLVDAHDAVAEVVVLADHVGVRVVQLVVRVLPLLGRGGVVPLPGGGVDLRVAHPVPLAVQDVVADLHVLQDLGHRQAGGADQPGGREQREQQHAAAAQLELALGRDDLADVGGVSLAAGGDHLGRGWRPARGRGSRCRSALRWAIGLSLLLDGGHEVLLSEFDVAGAGRGGHAGLDEDAVPGAAVVISPLRRSRTAPCRSGATQPKQMPIRQPGRHQHAGLPRRRRAAAWRRRRRRSSPAGAEGDGRRRRRR